jgi:CAP-Gly domain-containing linker protein 1
VLEDNLEQGLAEEEQALKSEPEVAVNSTVADLQRALREQKSKFEVGDHSKLFSKRMSLLEKTQAELEQLRKKLTEVEMKHTRTVHDVSFMGVSSGMEI